MEHLRCVVERITYQNAENGYTVLKCAVKNYSELVTVVGTMPDTHVGSVLALEGMWKMDAKYGRQFSVEKFEETLPATVYGIEKYLGSGLVKGVGPKFAKRIVEKFGKDTLDVIEDAPDELLKVPGIGKVRVDRIKTSWQEQKEIKNIMLFLQSHEVSTSHATKIFKTYGSESIEVVKENPYRLADDIWGIGFKTADLIAQKMGIDKGKFVRLRSGIFYTLNKLAESGDCYATREQLIGRARELLEVEEPELEITLDEMIRTNDVIRDVAEEEEAIYLPPYYFSESGCAKRLLRLISCSMKKAEGAEEILKKVAASSEITYDEIQWQALKTALSSKVMVLTGGPGTGKTTTTLGIISAYKQAGSRIVMNAHRINKGENIDMRGGKDADFFFASKESNQEVVDTIVQYCKTNLPRYYHVDPLQDIQVLTPMQRGECGAVNLNQVLQEAMNPTGIFLRRGGTQYRLNDKVMQIRNDYDKEVFNGDIGTITKVDMEERELTALFDEREVVYDVTELDELTLAYAVTIHKSQGSEYPIVVMPFTMSHFVMLQRNLLYTGVTRAKKILVLVGEKKAVYYAIKNETTTGRNTWLKRRLHSDSKEAQEVKTQLLKEAMDQTENESDTGNATSAITSQKKDKMIVYKGSIQPSMVCETPAFYEGNLWKRLSQSKFRSSFSLKANDRSYVSEKGMDKVREHACDFIRKRLSPADIPNDGKQTPMRGHPVFVAQHATATCCRDCLEKWHHIQKGQELTETEQEYVVGVIMEWIDREMKK